MTERLDDAVRCLYAACHLRPPMVVTARNAIEFARLSSILLARTGRRRSLLIVPLMVLVPFFAVFLIVVATAAVQGGPQLERMLEPWFVTLVLLMTMNTVLMPTELSAERSEINLPLPVRLVAAGASIVVMTAMAWLMLPVGLTGAASLGALLTMGLTLVLLVCRLCWPVWRRRELSADLGVRLPAGGAEPVRDVVEHRLASAIVSVHSADLTRRPVGFEALERTRRVDVDALIDREGRRLAPAFWLEHAPVLGRTQRTGPGREIAILALEERDEATLPAILQAAVAIDRMADALCTLDGVAVVLPAGAPLTYRDDRSLPSPGRQRHAAVFDWLGYRGPLAAAVAALPAFLGDRLLARYIVRVPEAARRTPAIQAFGAERFFGTLAPRPVQEDRFGRLYLIGWREDPSAFVEVRDATITPDGTRRRYWLPVSPHVASAHEAVAETFGKTAHNYNPDVES